MNIMVLHLELGWHIRGEKKKAWEFGPGYTEECEMRSGGKSAKYKSECNTTTERQTVGKGRYIPSAR